MSTLRPPRQAAYKRRLEAAFGSEALGGALRGSDFILSSRRLWLISIALYRSGHPRLAKLLKNVNSMLYHNSLPCEATVSHDVRLGHHGLGTVLHPKIRIGSGVKIFQNVTMAVRPPLGPNEIVIEDGVVIGANAVIITPRNRSIRIGRGASVGAGTVITRDVPDLTIAIGVPPELRERTARRARAEEGEEADV